MSCFNLLCVCVWAMAVSQIMMLHGYNNVISLLLQLKVVLFSPQTDADPEVCKRMCKASDYNSVLSLVSYYQMVRQ